jgi:hypothetical protein
MAAKKNNIVGLIGRLCEALDKLQDGKLDGESVRLVISGCEVILRGVELQLAYYKLRIANPNINIDFLNE